MTDQTQVQDTATNDAAQDVADDQQQGTAQDATTPTPTGFEALPPETQKEIRALRSENAKHRKALKEFEDAQKTELERYQSEAEDYKTRYETLSAQLRDTKSESAFLDAATKAHARAPKTLFRAYRSDLEYDDDGNVTNLDAVLAKAQEDEPDLFVKSTGSADGGRRGETSTEKMDMNDALRYLRDSAPR